MMIFAESALELHEMLELLHDELDAIGIEMHSSKPKIITSINDSHAYSLIIRSLNLVKLPLETLHLYLGRFSDIFSE